MADPKDVLKYLKLSVQVVQEPDEDIRMHLKNTILGTPGKLRYRHTSFDTKLPFLGRIYFFTLRKSEKLLGTVAFSLREIQTLKKPLDAWYIRYFSMWAPLRDPTFRRKRMKRLEKKKHREKPHGDNLLKNFGQPYFDDPDKLLSGNRESKSSSLIYAYVERENLRSWNFSQVMGFETVGKIHTSVFSRYNPKKHPMVSPIEESEKAAHLDNMREFYSGHTFFTEQNIFFGNHYLVCREKGEIIAGCQANPEVWDLVDYPGGFNMILMKYGTRLPVIRRMFDPGHQKFIAVEGIWFRKGYEKCLHPLFETACAIHGYHNALIWLDESSPVLKALQSLGKPGIISKLLKPAVGDIRVKFNNYPDEDKKVYFDRPAYISCFDMT